MAIDPGILINIGGQENDGTGDSIRTAFEKVNFVFTDIYGNNGAITTSTLLVNTQLIGPDLAIPANSDTIIPFGVNKSPLFKTWITVPWNTNRMGRLGTVDLLIKVSKTMFVEI